MRMWLVAGSSASRPFCVPAQTTPRRSTCTAFTLPLLTLPGAPMDGNVTNSFLTGLKRCRPYW
ncbi:hypothetical protein [Lysobacter gummosus]|uniref:hypothetical protein n=1 Tax=Lysobacter gummosus TaxID=262324 RepID=UPI003644D18A